MHTFNHGVAERRVRELQELGRTEIIHAQNRWKEAITPNMWPNATVTGSDCYNEAPTSTLKRSPCEVFTNSKVMPNPMAWMPFGCPVYVLDKALQNTTRILNKWKHRSRVGVYLGRSPLHAATVALVLNLQTGRVSPQFHVQFDPSFQTVNPAFGGTSPVSNWQAICGFTKEGAARAARAEGARTHSSNRVDPHTSYSSNNSRASRTFSIRGFGSCSGRRRPVHCYHR